MDNLPLYRIGDNVMFSEGVTLSVDLGRNEYVATPAAMFTIGGAIIFQGVWHYYEKGQEPILYPETAAVELPE